MKKYILALLFVCLFLSGCGNLEQSEQEKQEEVQIDTPAENISSENSLDFSSVEEKFSSVYSGAEITVKDRSSYIEVTILCNDLSLESKPENWTDICAAAQNAAAESELISAEEYGIDTVSFQITDSAENILGSGFGDQLQFDVFAEKTPESTSNDPRITLFEYDQLVVGMSYSECVEIIGGPGTLSNEIGSSDTSFGVVRSYTWQGTTEHGKAILSFDDYELYSKVQVGLE